MYQSGSPRSSLWASEIVSSGRSAPETGTIEYKVREGECLCGIVRKLTGTTNWRPVYELNKNVIGQNPNKLEKGMVLLVPNALVENSDDY